VLWPGEHEVPPYVLWPGEHEVRPYVLWWGVMHDHRPAVLGSRFLVLGSWFFGLLILLAACGPAPAQPTPRPVPLLVPRPDQPAATVVSEGLALPGRLLFASGGDLWLWQGEAGRQFTTTGDAAQPAWSPDGTRLAYIRRGESYSDLVVAPADGGEALALTDNGSANPPHSYERIYDTMWAFYPAFSPDGAEIAFVSQDSPPFGAPATDYHLGLFVTPSRAGGQRSLRYVDAGGHVGRLAYAPNGSAIVFAYGPVGPGAALLYRFAQSSATAEPLPGALEPSYDPAFSPDGSWLAFAARDAKGTDIFVMPAAGGSPARLTDLGTARAPAFSPDGRLLAFLAIAPGGHSFDLWVVELQAGTDGAISAGEPQQITQELGIDADSGVAWGK
jgi:TolB protein